jgi:Arc/MetJ-type ribon-helix-helix transcriptional regulator
MARPSKYKGEPLIARSLKFPPSLWQRLEAQVPPGERSDFIREALEEKLEREHRQAEAPPAPVWEVVRNIFSDVPDEEKERLPADLSENLDHYIYGTKKK